MSIKLDQLTTAEAMSHPDVALTINTLGKMADDLRKVEGNSMAYTDDHFWGEASQLDQLSIDARNAS